MSANTDVVLKYIGGLSGTLAWDAVMLQTVVDDAVELMGVSDEATAQGMTGWKPVIRYSAAKRIVREVSMDFNYSADGESFSRSNVPEQTAKYLLKDALADALPYISNGTSDVESVDLGWNPYRRTEI